VDPSGLSRPLVALKASLRRKDHVTGGEDGWSSLLLFGEGGLVPYF
jgi:hypothetical protein